MSSVHSMVVTTEEIAIVGQLEAADWDLSVEF
jgi:hypothetical protein